MGTAMQKIKEICRLSKKEMVFKKVNGLTYLDLKSELDKTMKILTLSNELRHLLKKEMNDTPENNELYSVAGNVIYLQQGV